MRMPLRALVMPVLCTRLRNLFNPLRPAPQPAKTGFSLKAESDRVQLFFGMETAPIV
jgi:hypothetical protein